MGFNMDKSKKKKKLGCDSLGNVAKLSYLKFIFT